MERIEFVNPEDYAPGEEIPFPDDIETAIRCLDRSRINVRNWRPLPNESLTTAEQAMRTLESVVKVPSGMLVGKPLRFMFFQEVIIYILLDAKPSVFILSMARRNGKTFILAIITLIYLISDLAVRNSLIASAAMSRDQAAILYKEIENIVNISPVLKPFVRSIPSSKRVVGLIRNAEYQALAAEAKTGYGRSFKIVVLDEAGQIVGPHNDYISMLRTSQGSIEDPLFAIISTQSASDADYLSVMLDVYERDAPSDAAVLLFETPTDYKIDDENGWYYSNPGLGVFRSLRDMRQQSVAAKQVPDTEASFRNLNLNQRIALDRLWLSPSVWKSCNEPINMDVFKNNKVALGIDLSLRTDLTAAVFAAKDGLGNVHVLPLAFTPSSTVKQRELRDKAPYSTWIRQGKLIAVPGSILEYDWIAKYLGKFTTENGIDVTDICYDRWRMDVLKREFEREELFMGVNFISVGQGYKDMSPRVEHFESMLLSKRLCHGGHPLLALGAGSAIATRDPSGNRKLDKSKTTQRIDVLVAAVMAVFGVEETELIDIDAWIV